jgi:hypothetical protein
MDFRRAVLLRFMDEPIGATVRSAASLFKALARFFNIKHKDCKLEMAAVEWGVTPCGTIGLVCRLNWEGF